MPILDGAGRYTAPSTPEPNRFDEHLRNADLSVGTYCIPRGGVDDQVPHTEDEIYVVTSGRATFVDSAGQVEIGPGDTLFVPAGAEHRFVEVTEDLTLVVVFAPAYRSRA